MKTIYWCVVVAAGILGAQGLAHADLIEAGLTASGDGLLTQDTATGLEWLDLTETTYMTVSQIEGDTGGWLTAGFRYGTEAEIGALFQHAGTGVTIDGSTSAANAAAAEVLADLMGDTGSSYDTVSGAGFTATRVGATQARYAYYRTYLGGTGLLDPSYGQGSTSASGLADVGHFLVRRYAVPEPGTLALVGLGALGLLARRRRRIRCD